MDEEEVTMASKPYERSRRKIQPSAGFGQRPHAEGSQDYGGDVEPNALLGQFSFAPATQTTVVTTTTTTTTKFPPLLMRPPRRMHELDLKLYPLAASPTPPNLKNISFEIDGKPTIFREAEDTTLALEQLEEEQQSLRIANGPVRHVQTLQPRVDTDPLHPRDSFPAPRRAPGRPASPESITDHDDSFPSVRTTANRGHTSSPSGKRGNRAAMRSHPRIRNVQMSHPITPESIAKAQRSSRRRNGRASDDGLRNATQLLPSPNMEQEPTSDSDHSRRRRHGHLRGHHHHHQTVGAEGDVDSISERGSISRTVTRGHSQETTVPTPPIDTDGDHTSTGPLSRRALSSIPSRLHVAESPSVQDGSLPSPSLSPVTAAATMQNAGYFADVDSNSEIASQHDQPLSGSGDAAFEPPPPTDSFCSVIPVQHSPYDLHAPIPRFLSASVTEIPAMLDYFDAIPDELKSYVMHQLLRRCPKPTLQMVADVVNPALKCDFLSVLPPELGLNVLKYLDLRSLCKAAQVSKKWRQMINSDEKAWKELFDADGFTLPDGELLRAITEGWGWQDPVGLQGYEQDWSATSAVKSESDANTTTRSSPSPSQPQTGLTGLLRRSKRKATTMLSSRNKQVKRLNSPRQAAAVDVGSIDWMSQMSTAEGPYNAANAAIMAVPSPNVGLPSLKGLHLYKSLYRRQYLIRRNWMFEDTKPRHIAFRAHDTHVVTCLQFDTDKILTGSDDNNINVYDTRTGALRAKLKGHEGGVWALQYEGNTLVSGSTDRSVRVWNIAQGRETQVFRGHTSTVRCLQIVSPVKVGENAEGKPIMMPKQALIITGSRDSTLRVWKLPRPDDEPFIQAENDHNTDDCPYFVRTLTGHQHSVRAIAAYADTLVSGSYDCTVRVWKISTGETIHRLQGHTQKVYSVVLDHARNRCISGSMDTMVRIWSLDTGSLIYTLEGHSSLVGLLDLNCDRLVSAAADSTLRIWDPENGQCKATLSAHTGAITCFQHDGQKVISGSDRTLKLWNIKTGECIKDLLSDLSGVWQVKFNERRCVAAVQRDGLTYIEVLDFGAARDGIPESKRGRRIVVDAEGYEVANDENGYLDLDGNADT